MQTVIAQIESWILCFRSVVVVWLSVFCILSLRYCWLVYVVCERGISWLYVLTRFNKIHGLNYMSRDTRFLSMWYVRQAKAQISLHISTVWSELLLVAWIFYESKATDQTSNVSFWAWKEAAQAGLSLHLSKCHIVGNHMSWSI